jgi:hypothetical protein
VEVKMSELMDCSKEVISFIIKHIHLQDIFYITAMVSVVIVALQFGYNIKWNKKQLTLKTLNSLKDDLKEHFNFLHDTFKYRDLEEPISVEDIHKEMGVFLEDVEQTKKKS